MSGDERPAPLVPAEVDLRSFPYLPLHVARLRDSDAATVLTGDEFRAAMLLCCTAWHQMPAASLPDDDRLLARYAGVEVGRWKRIRAGALRGFVKCSDARLYHRVLSELALEAWAAKVKQRAKTRNATDARIAKRRAVAETDVERDGLRNVERDVGRDVHQGRGNREGTEKEGSERAPMTADASPAPAPEGDQSPNPELPLDAGATPAGLACRAMKAAKVPDVNPSHPTLRKLIDAGVTTEQFADMAAELVGKGKGRFVLVLATLEGRLPDAAAAAAIPAVQRLPWDHDRTTIVAKAAELGMPAWDEYAFSVGRGETFQAFTARVRKALEAQQVAG